MAPGCVNVQSNWQHWPCLIPQHGPGRKHERPIVLEDWQRQILANDLVDIPWRQSNKVTISVSIRPGVARLDELIGPKS